MISLFSPTPPCPDLWHYLRQRQKEGAIPVLYGMGNGADKIFSVCAAYGIEPKGVFASDEFVRGQTFHGHKVQTFSELRAGHGAAGDSLIILVAFGSARPEVLARIHALSLQYELYIPDVPAFGNTLFCDSFVQEHQKELDEVRSLWQDDLSRTVWDALLQYKRTGRLDLLQVAESAEDEALHSLLRVSTIHSAMDLGAYRGETIRMLLDHAPTLSWVLAMEPDRHSFKKLQAYAATEHRCRILPLQAAAYSRQASLFFQDTGNRNAGLTENIVWGPTHPPTQKSPASVSAMRADEAWFASEIKPINPPDLIKYDVEGAEEQALLGSSRLLTDKRPPRLLVSLYHRTEDLYRLPLLIHQMQPAYRLYLRKMRGIPAWDVNLYAVAQK